MTKLLRDILRQPAEMSRVLTHFTAGEGAQDIRKARAAIGAAKHVFLTGIGSSWHAAMSVATLFYQAGKPVYLMDAAELLHFAEIPRDSAVIMLSRTGRSIEIVRLLEKVHANASKVIGVTNGPDGALAIESDVPVLVQVDFDHGISVNTYSTLLLAAALLAGDVDAAAVRAGIQSAEARIPKWQEQIESSPWLSADSPHYFLARGCSSGVAFEARLLWEEGVKRPATAMGSGAFRHGPQEIVVPGVRFAMWLDAARMRSEDLSVAQDLSKMGAHVALIGEDLGANAADLVFDIPVLPADWQFIVNFLPAQLLAERTSRLAGSDCDSFRFCSYVVTDEAGLLKGRA